MTLAIGNAIWHFRSAESSVPAAGQAECGVDEPDVAVRLREVAALLERVREDVLRVQAEPVVEAQEPVEEGSRLVGAPDERERLDEPERADGEGRLHVPEVVLHGVAPEEAAVDGERGANGVDVARRPR